MKKNIYLYYDFIPLSIYQYKRNVLIYSSVLLFPKHLILFKNFNYYFDLFINLIFTSILIINSCKYFIFV